MKAEAGRRAYAELGEYSAIRTKELSPILEPLVQVTDSLGELICEITLILGKIPPVSERDRVIRDLMADTFDFLVETRPLILKGKLEIAYPVARRAYESLSLLVACHLDGSLARRWSAGKQIGNAEIRRILGRHPLGEPEDRTRELYKFFSRSTHPNREHMPYRFLGDGNEFTLGAIGRPSLVMLADYSLKLLNLWFWFTSFVSFVHMEILARTNPGFHDTYRKVTTSTEAVAQWLANQFNHLLAEERAEMAEIRSSAAYRPDAIGAERRTLHRRARSSRDR